MKPVKPKSRPKLFVSCRQCACEFVTHMSDKVFCSDLCRTQFNQRLKYKPCAQCGIPHVSVTSAKPVCVPCLFFDQVHIEKRELTYLVRWLHDKRVCFYCGEYGTDVEHVVPRVANMPTWTVLACQECNGIAGGNLFPGILDKLEYIRARRRNRYAKALAVPEWTKEELTEMGRAMRASILAHQTAAKLVKAQLDWNPLALALREEAGNVVGDGNQQPNS